MYQVPYKDTFLPLVGADTETFLICKENISPDMICLSAAMSPDDPGDFENYDTSLIGNNDLPALYNEWVKLLTSDIVLCFHSAAYDLCVAATTFPDLLSLIFEALEAGRVKDTLIREKLLNLADHGSLTDKPGRGGGYKPIGYKLSDLLDDYTGIDISDSKNAEDAWRLNYHLLDKVPAEDYPKEASEYSIFDSVYLFPVYEAQRIRNEALIEQKIDALATEDWRVYFTFCLKLISIAGMRVDPVRVKEIRAHMDDVLDPKNFPLMIREGILIPAVPPVPHKAGTKNHVETCIGHKEHPEFKKTVKDCECPVKMKQGKAESIGTKRLREFVTELAASDKRFKLRQTDPSSKYPEGQLCVDKNWMEEFAEFNPLLMEFQARQKEIKVVTSYLNNLENAVDSDGYIYHNYNSMVETGRTSSYGQSKKKKIEPEFMIPSWNVQQVDPRVRPAIIPRDGYYCMSTDFNSLELITSSQENIRRFGFSRQADVINKGWDAHAYLATKLALELDPDFMAYCTENYPDATFDDIYQVFKDMSKSEDPDVKAFFKKFRTLAKPTGLGFPGGMGPATVQGVAKDQYKIKEPVEVFKDIRGFWKTLYPDMKMHLDDINNNRKDPRNSPRYVTDKATGDRKEITTYRYKSPMGMWRSGCTYTACANGLALQTPGAEGAGQAVINVVRSCYDKTRGSILYGGNFIPTAFIHDEIFGDMKKGEGIQERIKEVENLMCAGLDTVTPDVKTGVETVLLPYWEKYADPVYNEKGELIVWAPKEKK